MLVENNESVIDSMVASFLAAVPKGNSLYRKVVPLVADSDSKHVWALTLSVDYQLRPDGSHRCPLSSTSDPELHGEVAWGVNHELFCVFVIFGCRQNSPHIRAMA